MKAWRTFLVVSGAMALLAAPVLAANGDIRLSWDDCDPLVQNKDYTGPSVYDLVLSVANADVANNGHRTKTMFGPNIPEGWEFGAGCQTGQMAVSHSAVNKACPAYQGSNSLGLNQDGENQDGTAILDIANAYDLLTPVLGTRYTMWKAAFDHGFSAPGDEDPLLFCRFAATSLCIVVPSTVGGASPGR